VICLGSSEESMASQMLRNTVPKETHSLIFSQRREILQDVEKGMKSEIRTLCSEI
jgi:hypothetical protein